MPTKAALVGRRYGRLTIIADAESIKGQRRCVVQCDCGAVKTVHAHNVLRGKTTSCGCASPGGRTKTGKNKTHGMTGTKMYRHWRGMLNRCYYEKHDKYHLYGGRGIAVCDRWRQSFEDFSSDMGQPPQDGMTVDRKDVNGNYEPANCRWATQKEQCRNTRKNTFVTVDGERRCLVEWSEYSQIPYNTIISRLASGWSAERAVTVPSKRGWT